MRNYHKMKIFLCVIKSYILHLDVQKCFLKGKCTYNGYSLCFDELLTAGV
jgi:hypothetical protein